MSCVHGEVREDEIWNSGWGGAETDPIQLYSVLIVIRTCQTLYPSHFDEKKFLALGACLGLVPLGRACMSWFRYSPISALVVGS